jgi:hypothetical protein
MRQRSTGRLILSILFAFVASAAALGQTAQSVDIARGWRLEAFALNVLADVELRSGDTKASCAILNATLDLELRCTIGDRFGEAESLVTQAPLARAKGRDADVVGLLGDARRRRVEIGDRPGIAECNAELARLAQRPVPA